MPSAASVRTARVCAAIRSSMVCPHRPPPAPPVSAPMTNASSSRTAVLLFVFDTREHALTPRAGLATETLEAGLAADAGFHLGDRLESRRRNWLGALHADAVCPLVQPVQRSGQTLGALLQQLTRGQADVTTRADLDLVDLVGEARVLADRAGQVHDRHRSAELTKSRKGCVEVPPDPVSDVGASVRFHRFSLHIECFIGALSLGAGGGADYWTLVQSLGRVRFLCLS